VCVCIKGRRLFPSLVLHGIRTVPAGLSVAL
jgi:hypothetical protein